MDYSEKWGTSVDEAVRLALADLDLTIDEVTVTVLEEPSKGFLGIIGSKLAKVRVEKKFKEPEPAETIETRPAGRQNTQQREERSARSQSDQRQRRDRHRDKPRRENRPAQDRAEKAQNVSGADAAETKAAESRQPKREKTYEKISHERPADVVEVTDHAALTFLRQVTEQMGLDVNLKAEANSDVIYIDIDGKDTGTVIGKRGQTLDSIQYLTSLVVNRESEKYVRVVLDAENYRRKREKTLENLANRLGDKVVRSRRSIRLEPMNPYERKVIHATLQSNPKVTTRSEGEEPYRRVIIELK